MNMKHEVRRIAAKIAREVQEAREHLPVVWITRRDGSARPQTGGDWLSPADFADVCRTTTRRLIIIPDNFRDETT